MRPMMTFVRINLERRFCASKWRKFQLEKNASFFRKWTCEIIIIISRDIKKKEERERERVKEEG